MFYSFVIVIFPAHKMYIIYEGYMNLKIKLGKRIKELRKKSGYSQEKLAEKLGIAQNTLSKIETGENFLTSETLENLSDVLHVTLNDLFDFEHHSAKKDIISEINTYFEQIKNDDEKLVILYKIVRALAKD